MSASSLVIRLASLAVLVAAMVAGASPPAPSQPIFFRTLLGNPGAEDGPASPDGQTIVPIPQWTVGGNLNVVAYGTPGAFPTRADPGPSNRGAKLFVGGPASDVATGAQTVLVPPYQQIVIDTGYVLFSLEGYLGGYLDERDYAEFGVTFLDDTGQVLLGSVIGPVTREERGNLTGLLGRGAWGEVPVGTRRMELLLTMTRFDGSYNNGFADNLSFDLFLPDPVEPSTWGRIKAQF